MSQGCSGGASIGLKEEREECMELFPEATHTHTQISGGIRIAMLTCAKYVCGVCVCGVVCVCGGFIALEEDQTCFLKG